MRAGWCRALLFGVGDFPKGLGGADRSGRSAFGTARGWSLCLPHALAVGGSLGEIANAKRRPLASPRAFQFKNGDAKGHKTGDLGYPRPVLGGYPRPVLGGAGRRECTDRFPVLTCP